MNKNAWVLAVFSLFLAFMALPVSGTADSPVPPDLVIDESRLAHTPGHFFRHSSLRYDDKRGLLFLKTKDDRSYRFSIKTGEIDQGGSEGGSRSQGPGNKAGKVGECRERTLLRAPVQVTARLMKEHLPSKEIGGSCEFELVVRKGKEEFLRNTTVTGVDTADQGFEVVKKGSRWKGKYLLVRTECGGGNAWRCNRDAVFMVRADRLRSVGEVFGGDRDEPARSYRDGYFWDIYSKFDMNELTDHARAPTFWIALREKAGELKADLSRTWLRNRDDFQKRMSGIEAVIKERRADGRRNEEFEHLVLCNAVLAKYCARRNEAAKLEKLAELHFEPRRLVTFRSIMMSVYPAEYPLNLPSPN